MGKGASATSPLGGVIRPTLGAIKTGAYNGGRKNGGYSVRAYLEANGVTQEAATRQHLSVLSGILDSNPSFDITRYRVDPNYPNSGLPLMG